MQKSGRWWWRIWPGWEGRYKATWESGIQTLMAQGRSTTVISMIQWTRTSRLSINMSLCLIRPARDSSQIMVLPLVREWVREGQGVRERERDREIEREREREKERTFLTTLPGRTIRLEKSRAGLIRSLSLAPSLPLSLSLSSSLFLALSLSPSLSLPL